MVKPIRECQRCGGNVLERVHPTYGLYSQCVQCGHDETAATPREILTGRGNRGRAVPELSPVRIWQGQVWRPY